MLPRLSKGATGELGVILPRIRSNYRELIIGWASNPQSLMAVATFFKGALGIP
jgi:hypothetical protein